MKKFGRIAAYLGIVLIVFAALFFRLRVTSVELACDKPSDSVGTCVRLVHAETLLGWRDDYSVELTPTNSGEFESSDRKLIFPFPKQCFETEPVAVWDYTGVQIGSDLECFVSRSAIGTW